MKLKHKIPATLFATASTLLFPLAASAVTVISPSSLASNGGFESDQLNGALGTRTGSTSGNGGSQDRFAVNPGTITVDGWFIETTGFGGLDGSQINDFTNPPPGNGQDASPNKGFGDSRRVLLANSGVTVTATSDDLGSGNISDLFTLSYYTAGNQVAGGSNVNNFTVNASIIFDRGLLSEATVNFNSINHLEPDEAPGTLANNVTNGFILRDSSALGTVSAPTAYTTAELILELNNSNGGNDQVYLDNVTLDIDVVPEPSISMLGLLAVPFLLRRRRA